MNTRPVSLLIVDDDPVFAEVLGQMVRFLGADFPCVSQWVDCAESAMEALQRSTCDLVLLDYHLPGADGLQLLAHIRSLPDPQPAVIMLTGSGSEEVAVEAMKRGARDYLCKANLDVAPLLRSLRSALAQKRLADEVALYMAQTRADLQMARQLQQSLLPDSYPSFPRSAPVAESALRFCHRFCPAAELAGDFFSVFPLADTRAGVFMCDVMGHGVRSALVTAMVRALVDSAAPVALEPGHFLAEMNARLTGLLKSVGGPMFATACFLTADIDTGTLCFATAGHPPPLHLRRRAGETAPLRLPPAAGPALGLFPEAVYATGECSLAEGDVILLFTDGLFEVASPEGDDEYGMERLLAAARQRMHLEPPELCDALIAEVQAFAEGAPFSDDVCLLSMEVARLHAAPDQATL